MTTTVPPLMAILTASAKVSSWATQSKTTSALSPKLAPDRPGQPGALASTTASAPKTRASSRLEAKVSVLTILLAPA